MLMSRVVGLTHAPASKTNFAEKVEIIVWIFCTDLKFFYNGGHTILRLFDVSPIFSFAASETELDF